MNNNSHLEYVIVKKDSLEIVKETTNPEGYHECKDDEIFSTRESYDNYIHSLIEN